MIRVMGFKEQAVLFSQISAWTYLKSKDFSKILKEKGYNFEYITKNSSQAYVVWNDDDIIIGCRGTEATNLADIETDLKVIKVKLNGKEKIHAGFKESADNVWPQILAIIKKIADEKYSAKHAVWIAGHSLGAAMATILALYAAENNIRISGLFTFGSPRVGNRKFVKALERSLITPYRFVNCADVVTRVPNIGYRHFGDAVYIDRKGRVSTNTSSSYIIYDRFVGFFKSLLQKKIQGLDNHFINNYKEQLEKWSAS